MPPTNALEPTPQPLQRLGFPQSLRSFGAAELGRQACDE
jgi:hypothetical protein